MRHIALLFLVVPMSCFAQFQAVVKDGIGNILGSPLEIGKGINSFRFLTPDGTVVHVFNTEGTLQGVFGIAVYEEENCVGPPLLPRIADTFLGKHMMLVYGEPAPAPVAIIPQQPPWKEMLVRSTSQIPVGCYTHSEPEIREAVPYFNYVIEDPTQIGLELKPEPINAWGFPSPLTIDVIPGDALFCNGFENCPTE